MASSSPASLAPSASLLHPSPKSSSRKQITKPLILHSLHRRPLLSYPLPRLRPILSDSRRHLKQSKLRFAAPESASAEISNCEDEEELEGGAADRNNFYSLREVMGVYKEAVIAGDLKTVSEIEAKIWAIEKNRTELQQKVLLLSEEINSGKEKYIRLQADFDNFRKRSEKDRLTTRSDAQGDVIESLLPMVDNFERAKQQLKPETEKEKKIDTSYQGIYKQFVEIMRSLRVAAVPTVGKPFDPLVHEAIAREESQEFKEGIIILEFRRGFLLGGRLLRPAMVKVSAGPGKRATSVASEKPAATAGVDEH